MLFRTTAILLLCSLAAFSQKPVIFDTDMGNDVDDALALAILHALSDRGECRLIGVTLTNGNSAAVPYIQLLNRFYGRNSLPVGFALKIIKGGADDGYLSAVLKSAPASLLKGSAENAHVESALPLLRKLLASSSQKVTIIQVGFSSNLAALLHSQGDAISPLDGEALVRQKVELLSTMAGDFSGGKPEYNVRLDIPAAQAVFEHWPSPIVFSGFEIGNGLVYPADSVEHDFTYTKWHPVAESYRAFNKMPYNRPTWDLTAALQAVRGNHNYFAISESGEVRVESDGATRFEPGHGNRRVLRPNPASKARVIEALTLLASEPPLSQPRN